MNNGYGVGAEIAKGLRGCCSFFFVPVISICSGIAIGQNAGVALGILGGIGAGFASVFIISITIGKLTKELTYVDCLIPLIVSIISGVVFFPISLFTASLFSTATCILAGALTSLTLFIYKTRELHPIFLVIPFLVFIYEILPIELPSDLDNILALSGNTINQFAVFAFAKKRIEGVIPSNQPEIPE